QRADSFAGTTVCSRSTLTIASAAAGSRAEAIRASCAAVARSSKGRIVIRQGVYSEFWLGLIAEHQAPCHGSAFGEFKRLTPPSLGEPDKASRLHTLREAHEVVAPAPRDSR